MQQYVEAMQPGWNLGNTLDATPNETAWGNPLATQELIQHIKAQGFKSIRIPVTWDTGGRVGPAPGYTIDPAFMDRVQQVVDWSLDAGLYVMLNLHHDSGWVLKMSSDHDNVLAKFNAIWTQVATRFRDYPRELHFESINEPQFENANDATSMALLSELNTSFFHIVRNMGGGNATRPLVLPSLNTNSGQQYLDSLKATMTALNDSNLIATVHYYGFWPFSVNITGVTTVNDAVVNDIFSSVDNTFNTFIADGIPVIVGELGLLNWGPDSISVERGEVLKYFEIYTAAAQASGITWQLWDAGQLLNRYSFQWRDPELVGYYMQSLTTRSSTGTTDLVFVKTGAPEDVVIPLSLNGNSFVSLTNGGTKLTPGVDYAINGGDLTLKASLLAQYAAGEYGEKAVLEANFSAGMPWKIRVRHQATSILTASTGSKSDDLVLPVSFHGDLLATMEAKYVASPGYPYPGQANWTAFKQFGDSYQPNYASSTITLKKEFLAATNNEPVDLTFHFWSGRTQNYRLTFEPGGDIVTDPEQLVVYDDALSSGWNDAGSWAPHSFTEATTVHTGTGAISISAGGWGGLVLTNGGPAVDTSSYRTLVFWIHGGTTGGQTFGVGLNRGSDDTAPRVSIPTPQANTWLKVEIPLSSLGVEGSANITGVFFQNWSASSASTLYIDDLHLTTAYASDFVFVHGSPAPVISSPTAVAVTRGSALTYTVTADNDPDTVNVTGLPSWLTYDVSSGVISGTTMTPGTYQFTVTAGNGIGTTSEEITVRVDPTPIEIGFAEVANPSRPRVDVPYDGASHGLTAVTNPDGVAVAVSYEGGGALPTLPGTYRVVAVSDDPNYTGRAEATLAITSANPGRLINLSMRAVAGTGSDTLIMGFVASGGSGATSVLVRGIGPELLSHGVTGTLLDDPSLTLFEGSDAIDSNNDWDAALGPVFQQAGASELPSGSADAAIAADLPAGAYTAHITGIAGATGIALGEVYDLTETYSPTTPVLVNASARCQVGSGSAVLIPGFVIGGDTPLRVLIRAIGPALASQVDGMLGDPHITLFRGSEPIGSNDDWDGGLAGTFAKVGAFSLPGGSKDAAFVVELPPGGYTAHVQSVDGSPGVALVELYALPGL